MINHDFNAFLKKKIDGKLGVAATLAPKGHETSKVGPLGGTFGSTVISKNVFENLGPEPP